MSQNILLNAIQQYINSLKKGNINITSPGTSIDKLKRDTKEQTMSYLFSFNLKTNLVQGYINDLQSALAKSDKCFISIKFKTLRKFISGWSPIYFITEVPMSWDLVLDTPYISGSTIKGILRDYFNEIVKDDNKTSCIFGDKNDVGKVIFFNAYPISPSKILAYDILTPHYNNADNEYDVNPNPIKFLTINEGVEFITFIAFNKKELEECSKDSLSQILKTFLLSMKMGWGRRTSRGYGNLEIITKEVELKCPSS